MLGGWREGEAPEYGLEVGGGGQESVFYHFGETGEEVGTGEGGEEGGVDDDAVRGGEGADFVFQAEEVETGFSADGGIDLCQEGGGDVDAVHASLKGGGGESPEVGEDASAHAKKGGGAACSLAGKHFPEAGDAREGFVLFSCFEDGEPMAVAEFGGEDTGEEGNRVGVCHGVQVCRGGFPEELGERLPRVGGEKDSVHVLFILNYKFSIFLSKRQWKLFFC